MMRTFDYKSAVQGQPIIIKNGLTVVGLVNCYSPFYGLSGYIEGDLITLFSWDKKGNCLLTSKQKVSGLNAEEYKLFIEN